MKENRLVVTINAPVETVFEFTVNPSNTSKWIDHIIEEQASDWPPVVGTTYRNRTNESNWSEYTVTAVEQNKLFELASKNSPYHVRYTYTIVDGGVKLEYFEWMDEGELEDAFEQGVMTKLKDAIEKF